MAFAENLREIREARNLSQKELAEITDLSQSAISKFESEVTNPNKRTIKILANALNVTYDELTEEKQNEQVQRDVIP